MVNKILTHLGWFAIILAVAVSIGVCVGEAATRPLICQVWSWEKNNWRTVHCLKTGSDVRGGGSAELPTATIEYAPTETPVPWEPWSTPTRTAAPPFITATPVSYPGPETTATEAMYPKPESERFR